MSSSSPGGGGGGGGATWSLQLWVPALCFSLVLLAYASYVAATCLRGCCGDRLPAWLLPRGAHGGHGHDDDSEAAAAAAKAAHWQAMVNTHIALTTVVVEQPDGSLELGKKGAAALSDIHAGAAPAPPPWTEAPALAYVSAGAKDANDAAAQQQHQLGQEHDYEAGTDSSDSDSDSSGSLSD